ncbi:hypothetical protein EZJ49_01140 [Bdellovibrio bacteriovorus]|uniref:hypothetical protein n=1 Tax=Bdellovibrio bacteriovorus TaxID=959 RepID=UPI0021D2DB1D|nr:hypothetical protein [Bdellovibrio bacteriovorus]UXR64860.1 hypothetical protein EZJ49_01140 [Bdellovibrio bacteriovorus]
MKNVLLAVALMSVSAFATAQTVASETTQLPDGTIETRIPKIELEASSDIAYYVVARSGSYRVGRFSNTVELVSLEETLISELVQQNADFIFDRTIPVDQDIRLP